MSYRLVEGEGLQTRYEGTPVVVINAVPDGPVALEIVFQTESAPAGTEAAFTRLVFESVMEYRWVAYEQEYFPTNLHDYEFALIEIIDSEQISQMLDLGMYRDRPPGQRLGGVIDEADLRHYRLGFDDYGDFDVICLRLRIERFRALS
jgi:hypothetical protein